MKRITAYIFSLAVIFAACQKMEEPSAPEIQTATASFGICVADASPVTKSFDDSPVLSSLHVVVFDANGYRVESVPATLKSRNGLIYTYEVTLTASGEQRILHFIGNCTDEWKASLDEFGSERQLIPALVDDSGNGAFWQRIVLNDGIKSSEALKSALDNKVSLIRNYAKISLSSSDEHFTVKSMKVYNAPDRAYVAAYNANTGLFDSDYKGKTYAQIISNFGGVIPSAAQNIGSSTIVESDFNAAVAGTASDMVYERPSASDASAPFIIMKGSYNGHADTYYRINLRDNDGQYYALLRNFDYEVKVVRVTSDGKSSIAEAIASTGSGDVTTDLRFINVTNISNTESRIFISKTSETVVKQSEIRIKARFEPSIASPTPNNSLLSISVSDNDGHGNAVLGTPVLASSDDSDGWRTITINTAEPDPVFPKTQVITVTGTSGGKSISRTFTLTVRPTLKLKVSCQTKVAASKGVNVPVTLGVENGLPESIFPLSIMIEAAEGSLTPATSERMDVESGKSLSGSGRPAFAFNKTISYDEYTAAAQTADGMYKNIICNFTTNREENATMIYAKGELFNLATCGFIKQGTTLSFGASISEVPIGTGKKATLKFNVINQNPVTINLAGAKYNGLTEIRYTPSAACGEQTLELDVTSFGDHVSAAISADDYDNVTVGHYRYLEITEGSYNFSSIARTPCGFAAGATTADMSFDLLNASGVKVASLPYTVTRTATSETTSAPYYIPQGDVSVTRTGSIGNRKYNLTITLNNYEAAGFSYYYKTSATGTEHVLSPTGINGNKATFTVTGLTSSSANIFLYAKPADYVSGYIPCSIVQYNYSGQNTIYQNGGGDTQIRKYDYTAAGPKETVIYRFSENVTEDIQMIFKYNYLESSNGTKAFTLGVLSGDEAKPFDAGIIY